MPPSIQFSVEDLRTPEQLERVLQQFRSAIQSPAAPSASAMQNAFAGTSGLQLLNSLATQIAPLIRNQLQATGGSALNIQSLLPGASSTAPWLFGTHSTRLTNYTGSRLPVNGTPFFETDRQTIYLVVSNAWTLVDGLFINVLGNAPGDLGTADAGFQFYISDYAHLAIWDGAHWQLADGGGGYFVPSAFALGTGFHLCDGSSTNYILNNTTNLATASFTTPNLTVSGVYLSSGATYTGSFNTAAAPTFTGTPADTGNDTGTPQTVASGSGATVPAEPHQHPYTPAGTISLAGGDPIGNMVVLYYFRQ